MAKPSWTTKGHGGSMGQPRYKVEPNRIFPREEERPPRMTDGGGGKTLGPILPFPLLLSLFSPLLFLS